MGIRKLGIRLTSFQIILLSFLSAIVVGTGLLCLPISNAPGYHPSFMDSLFTATSAICVTGLVVRDTFQGWTLFGRIVIILLIQIGGMGVITIALLLAIFSGRKISLFQRSLMKEAVSAEKIGGIVRLTSFIVRTSLLIELFGAVLLSIVFIPAFGTAKGIGFSLFHSISAFCNAGFDLMGEQGKYSSLVSYIGNPIVNLSVMFLIIVGGLGFRTWEDIGGKGFHFRKYSLQTKVILQTTFFLILLPCLYFYFCEFQDYPVGQRFLASLFQAVTPRTAGFNTVDEASLSPTGQMLTIVLMLIGGAPGSTAGGMKVTTIAILVFSCISVFRHNNDTNLYNRRVGNETVRRASALLMLYIGLFLSAAMVISKVEDLPMMPCMFETASAIGTVGLTQGLTPELSTPSHLILVLLMFIGRVGGLTIIFATFRSHNCGSKMPQEDVSVG